jgi:hypothetical protein
MKTSATPISYGLPSNTATALGLLLAADYLWRNSAANPAGAIVVLTPPSEMVGAMKGE